MRFVTVLAGALALLAAHPAPADYPDKPIRFLAP